MHKYLALALAGTVALGACANNPRVAEGAAVGAVGGAAVGAVAPGISTIEGAAVGAAIGGLAGAVWADNNNDGYVDGYVYNGQYYSGTPQGYDPTLRRVATGALGGAALGAVAWGGSTRKERLGKHHSSSSPRRVPARVRKSR